ncbi:MAG TPA: SDR family oxidoreductase, partial [Longimicrobiales bacterium]|nr:SDR family oxidoreductase [Longimicrobiales bacterium]
MDLVVGATGKLGRAIVRRRLARGQPVRALTRQPERAADLRAAGADVVRGDLRDPASVRKALEGVSAVVAAAHSLLGRGANATERVDDLGHRQLIDRAQHIGIQHFVYTSIIGASPDHPIDFWRIKARIEEYLRSSGLPYTIFRPTAFIETHAHALLGEPFVRKGTALLFGRGDTPRNFVSVQDVAELMVRALEDPGLQGRTIEVGGVDNFTDRQVLELYAAFSGRELRMRRVPSQVLSLFSRLLRPIHPGLSRVMRISVLQDRDQLASSF